MRIATHYENIVYDDIARDGSHRWESRHIDANGTALTEVSERWLYSGKRQETVHSVQVGRRIGYREARRLIMNGCGAPTSALERLNKWDAARRAGSIEANKIGGVRC